MLTPEQLEAVRAYVAVCAGPVGSRGRASSRLMLAGQVGGWPEVARLLLTQHSEVDRLTRERDDLQDAIRVAWEAIDATTSLETETALHTLIQAVPLEVRQRWAREDGEGC